MKRAILIAFTGFYLALSLGFSLNLHYCGGKLAKVRIALPAPNCCCDADGDKSCCADSSLTLQMEVDQQLTSPPAWELNLPMASAPETMFQAQFRSFSPQKITPHFPNPPPLSSQKARIKLGSLTFYG